MRIASLALLLALGGSSLSAGVIFSENFEGTLTGNWAANAHGQIVTDPANSTNHVLNFSDLQGAGDLFSNILPVASTYYIEFDYYYGTAFAYGGGFVGVDAPGETWLLGDCNGCYSTYSTALDGLSSSTWHHIQLAVPATDIGSGPTQLKLEQFVGSAGNAYFDNIVISNDGFAAPEPGTLLLIGIGAGLVVLARKIRPSRR